MIDVSVIIVNYNTAHLVNDAIRSVVSCTQGVSYEVIVVDNNSTEDTTGIINSAYPDVTIIRLKENIGFGKANNEGAKMATGRNLLFLNPDTVLKNNAIKILSDYLDSHDDVGICGGNLYTADGQAAHSFKRIFPSITLELDAIFKGMIQKIRFGKNRDFNYTGAPLEVAYICGADLMISKNLFDECGGFEKDIFMYYEDSLLCHTAMKKGKKSVSLPSVEITHLEGRSFKLNQRREETIFAGRKVFFSKVYSPSYHSAANAINKTFLLIAVALCRLTGQSDLADKYNYRYKLYKENK